MSEVGEGSKSKLDEPPKRSRSAELHNISEREAICQAESTYPRGIHYTQVPFYSPFFPMRSLGHGMVVPVPNPTSHTATSVLPLSLGVAGLPLMSKPGILPVSQIQLPFTASQTLHTTAATSTVQPRFPSDLSFDYENLGNSSSRNTSQI
ncbi:hypothetical protein O6P43_032699 [Quillaja saponaria]|uniref:Uncharacterized protein n=1 Tax=Quillaja saponaria TaxID=32244 RepID=A0AAD7P5S5_QUISA|nr:hypothetical protein O6P43_032699 [Quillaja saponaria]